jgi:hypothetical protein
MVIKGSFSWLSASSTQVYHFYNNREQMKLWVFFTSSVLAQAKRERQATWWSRWRKTLHTRSGLGPVGKEQPNRLGLLYLVRMLLMSCYFSPCSHSSPFLPVPRKSIESSPEVMNWCNHRMPYFLPWSENGSLGHRVVGGEEEMGWMPIPVTTGLFSDLLYKPWQYAKGYLLQKNQTYK